jgi:hypothetical protein
MDRSDMIKYALIVLLALVLIFIFMRLFNVKNAGAPLTTDNVSQPTPEVSVPLGPPSPGPPSLPPPPIDSQEGFEHFKTTEAQMSEPQMSEPQMSEPQMSGQSQEVMGFSDNGGFGDVLASVPPSENQPEVNYKTCDLNKVSPKELLPSNKDTDFSKLNPSVNNNLKDKNFLEAGSHIGLDTIGQSLRNANYQLRADPPNPKKNVSPWMNSTIQPDPERKSLC